MHGTPIGAERAQGELMGALRLCEVERGMEYARDLRAHYCAAGISAVLRWLARAVGARSMRRRQRQRTAAPAATAIAFAAILAAGATLPVESRAQEPTGMTGQDMTENDTSALAAHGLELSKIETCDDAALLWQIVRELVLPGRLTLGTQRRILRRLWVVDSEIAAGSLVMSETQ